MSKIEKQGDNSDTAPAKQERQNNIWQTKGRFDLFLVSVYDLVTWVGIPISVGVGLIFAFQQNWRATGWSAAALLILTVMMLGIRAEQHRRGRDKEIDQQRVQLEPSKPESVQFVPPRAAANDDALEESRKLFEQQGRAIKAAEASAKIVEQTSIYANRAYLVAKIGGTSDDSIRLQFRLRIENTGNTPANNVRVGYNYGLRTEPPYNAIDQGMVAYDADFPQWESLGLIANRSEGTVNTGKVGPFTGPEFQDWKLGKLKFYCWGRIVYTDIYQYKRYTDFCFYQSFGNAQGRMCEYQTEAI
jgi:hypothetical protein